jgi:hypothetical protein
MAEAFDVQADPAPLPGKADTAACIGASARLPSLRRRKPAPHLAHRIARDRDGSRLQGGNHTTLQLKVNALAL